jgi:hypothetical protein
MKARFLTIPDSILCVVTPEEPDKAYVLGRCVKNIEQYRSVDWVPVTDPGFRPATQRDFKDFRVSTEGYRTDKRYDFPMHSDLEFFKQMNPQAKVECNNSHLYWIDGTNSHGISFLTDNERSSKEDILAAVDEEYDSKVLWLKCEGGWLRFVSYQLHQNDS